MWSAPASAVDKDGFAPAASAELSQRPRSAAPRSRRFQPGRPRLPRGSASPVSSAVAASSR
eukprot:11168989-Lingulodinium_polyedra.AAC.1